MSADLRQPSSTTQRAPLPWGCMLKLPVGCAAYALGALAALAAMVPNLISELASRRLEDAFADAFQGRLEVGRLDMEWFGRQRISSAELFLDDARVASVEFLEFPGIAELWREGFTWENGLTNLGSVSAKLSADLVLDDEHGSNLVRALTPREDSGFLRWFERGSELARAGSRGETAQGWARYTGDFQITVDRLRWDDSRTQRGGAPLELSGLDCHLWLEKGGTAHLDVGGGAPADVDLALTWRAPEVAGEEPEFLLDRWVIKKFPTRLAGRLVARPDMLEELLGETFDIDCAVGEPEDGVRRIDLDLSAPRASVFAEGHLDNDRLVFEAGAVDTAFQWPTESLDDLLGPDLLALGLERQTVGGMDVGGPISFSVEDQLVLPWRRLLDPRVSFAEQIDGIQLDVEADLGNWTLTSRKAGGLGQHTENLMNLTLALRSASEEGVVRSTIGLQGGFGKVDLSVELEDTAAFVAFFEGEPYAGAPIAVEARRLPSRSLAGLLPLPLGLDLFPTSEAPCLLTLQDLSLAPGAGAIHERFRGRLRLSLPTVGLFDPLTTVALADVVGLEVPVVVNTDRSVDFGLSGALQDDGRAGGAAVPFRVEARLGARERSGRSLDLTVLANGFPTSMVDTWLGTHRLLSDVLGATLDVERFHVTGEAGGDPRVDFELSSSRARATGTGRLTNGSLEAEGEDVVRIDYDLTPESVAALPTVLVPVLADVRGAERATLELGDFSLPLDGSVNRVTTEVALEFPNSVLTLHPALVARLALEAGAPVRAERDTVALRIEDGRAMFRQLTLELGKGRLDFDGGFDLKAGFMDLTSRIPLGLVGAGGGAFLDAMRKQLEETVTLELAVVGNRAGGLRVIVDTSAIEGAELGSLMKVGLEGLFRKE